MAATTAEFEIGNLPICNYSVRQKSLETIETFFDYVDAGGVAESDGSIVAKSGSRDDRDVGFAQKTISEVLRSEPKLADIDQDVKRRPAV